MNYNSEPSEEEKNNWSQDPNNWVWGIFYYNPKDKRTFPPKRIKQMGWTINFANPNSVFLCVIMILILMILCESVQR
ncbi:DUF5808 domain-containing protein [Flavobacterium aquidurense]|uniref:DUF5808 domain-containing protein n=1 Tax=Flavobacterium aquidurense TaxID=362413 RepID=UPI000922404F|nr:DUF5808 domain-containing protein [Flavobacterium aquidurense]OXA71885.1 hypothetical protein B0A67_09760 [Flavobacterium aquidurense]SHH54183.1 hypothetical protein SAMN05444481_11945 [Flavobacterium frigidimaris]